jgi:hypothetical protein
MRKYHFAINSKCLQFPRGNSLKCVILFKASTFVIFGVANIIFINVYIIAVFVENAFFKKLPDLKNCFGSKWLIIKYSAIWTILDLATFLLKIAIFQQKCKRKIKK